MVTEANAINAATTGIVGNTGTSFTATAATQYAILVGGSTSSTLANIGPTATAGQVLQSGGGSANPAFSTATYPSTTTINQILYSSAANVVAGLSTGNNGLLITGTTGIPSILANGTTGQVLTATTGSPPSWANAAAGGGPVQQVRANTTTPVTNTTSFTLGTLPTTSGGTQILSVAITPTNAAHILVIEYTYFACTYIQQSSISATPGGIISALFNGGSNAIFSQIDVAAQAQPSIQKNASTVYGRFYMTAGTTSATTFTVRIGMYGNDVQWFFLEDASSTSTGAPFACITVTEYTA